MRRVTAITALLLLAASSAARSGGMDRAADEDCVEPVVAAIQRRYEAVRDLAARFEQTTHSVALGTAGASALAAARGTVVFAKPGRMRWSYEEPEPSLVVSDGRTLWLYDAARGEAQRLPAAEGYLSGAAIQFLLGSGDILRDFRVSALACGEATADLELVPRQPASYERLQVRAVPSSGELLRTTVFDLLGNATQVSFSEVRTNRDPPPETFVFEPPEGVEVIELESAGPPPESSR